MELKEISTLDSNFKVNLQPSLQHLGIRFQKQVTPQELDPDFEIDQSEHLQLASLNLLDFEQAYVIHSGSQQESIELNTTEINGQRLLSSLQQLGQGLDLNRAIDLHHAARELIGSMRPAAESSSEADFTGYKLVLHGAFGRLELDFDKLQPEALRQAFAENLSEHPAQELTERYEQLGTLSHLIRAGFEDPDYEAILEQTVGLWLNAVQHSDLRLDQLFQNVFGYSALNQENSVTHLLRAFKPLDESDPNPQELALSIQARVQALIENANRLEQELTLTPNPNSPGIVDLFRSFQSILQQLDHDVMLLLAQQDQKLQLDRRILTHYAQRLHRNASYHQQRLNDYQATSSNRLQILVQQALIEFQSKLWLAHTTTRLDALQTGSQALENKFDLV